MTKSAHPTHEQIIDSAEKFYGQRITPDRQFIIQRSVACMRDHRIPYPRKGSGIDYSTKVWCPLAHEGRPYGDLFWCDCPCHERAA